MVLCFKISLKLAGTLSSLRYHNYFVPLEFRIFNSTTPNTLQEYLHSEKLFYVYVFIVDEACDEAGVALRRKQISKFEKNCRLQWRFGGCGKLRGQGNRWIPFFEEANLLADRSTLLVPSVGDILALPSSTSCPFVYTRRLD